MELRSRARVTYSLLTPVAAAALLTYLPPSVSRRPPAATYLLTPRALSDARVIREGPTISDVYYHKSTRCGGGVAPAIASGYKTCLRAEPPSPITD